MPDAPTNLDERDAQIRWRMLGVARLEAANYPGGFVSFPRFAHARDNAGVPCDGDEQTARLLADLVEWGYLEEQPHDSTVGGMKPTNKHRRFKQTDAARLLWQRKIGPVPGIDDGRN
jgi:hypothetical protein